MPQVRPISGYQINQDYKGIKTACVSRADARVTFERNKKAAAEQREMARAAARYLAQEEKARKAQEAAIRRLQAQEEKERKAQAAQEAREQREYARAVKQAQTTFDKEVAALQRELRRVDIPDDVYVIYDNQAIVKTDGSIWVDGAPLDFGAEDLEAACYYYEHLPISEGESIINRGRVRVYQKQIYE